MLRLENVTREGNKITAEFFFVGNATRGNVSYDILGREITSASYGNKNPLIDFIYGFGYVKKLLDMMVQYDKYPGTITYEWY